MAASIVAVVTGLTGSATTGAQETGKTTKPSQAGWSTAVETKRVKAKPKAAAVVVGLSVSGDVQSTRLTLDSDKPLSVAAYTLADPYRVVIDIVDAQFRIPEGMGASGGGLATALRYGLLDVGRSRIVVDVAGPVSVSEVPATVAAGGPLTQTIFDLVPVDAARFVATPIPGAEAETAGRGAIHDGDLAAPRKMKPRPVVVIDPGHGGLDPGAVAAAAVLEKNVVLSVGRSVAALLKASGKVSVVLTRGSDVFVPLARRVEIARRADADLFVSIHADAVAEAGLANSVRGASIYTLGDTASDERARLLAEKENASDIAAGLGVAAATTDAQVQNILLDLVIRETLNFSRAFQTTLADHLKGSLTLGRDPLKSGSFKVLRQATTPSVLIELGYMSHAEDQKLLTSAEWQQKVAATVARAIEMHFAGR
jgi:N-acetylmuramoyl-L-alanine amidase